MLSIVCAVGLLFGMQEANHEYGLPKIEKPEQENFYQGPLKAHGYTPFHLSSSDFTPNLPTNISEGEHEAHIPITFISVFTDPSDYVIDTEIVRIHPELWYGISDDWCFGVSASIYKLGGGRMDGFIDWFHDTFGFDGYDREEFPRDKFAIKTGGRRQELDSEWVFGDLTLALRHKIIHGDAGAISIGAKVQLPTNSNFWWYSRTGIGVGLDASAYNTIGDFQFYMAASLAWLGSNQIFGQDLVKVHSSALLSVDWRIFDDTSLILQTLVMSGIANDFGDYSKWATDVDLGLRIHLSNSIMLEIGLTENFYNYNNSADLGGHIGLVFKFK